VQLRKRVERAFRLLSPFNQGRLSPSRVQLLSGLLKAGHWPAADLFAFFDRDGDGAVSPDDFFEAQALIRTRDPAFLGLLFVAYLAAQPKGGGAATPASPLQASPRRSRGDQVLGSGENAFAGAVTLAHVRAMFVARGVPGGVETADTVFAAALRVNQTGNGRGGEWDEDGMGGLLPSNLSTDLSGLDLKADSKPLPLAGGGPIPSGPVPKDAELRFPQFAVAALALPVLVDAMLAETKSRASTVLGNAKGNAMPLVESFITEERASASSESTAM
jgi:hypothetical protein